MRCGIVRIHMHTPSHERRNPTRRAEFVRTVLMRVVQHPAPVLGMDIIAQQLRVGPETAMRIGQTLVNAGVFRQVGHAEWVRVIPVYPQRPSSRA